MNLIESETKPLHIVSLEAESFKRLRAVRIKPDGSVVQITGRNGQGKSSVIDAIAAALGGGREAPDMPIRKGNKRASVTIDLGELIVERSFTPSGASLKVTSKDGAAIKSPQALLDSLVGNLAFDPLHFIHLDPREQLATLKKVAGLEAALAQVEQERTEAVQAKTLASREVKSIETQLAGVPDVEGPDAEVSAVELMDRMNVASETNARNAKARKWLADAFAKEVHYTSEMKRLEAELLAAKEAFKYAHDHIEQTRGEIEAMKDIDVAAIRAEMSSLEARNETARRRQHRKALVEKLEAARAAEKHAHREVEDAELSRDQSVRTAKMPVKGLGLDDNGVTYNGVPFEQASTAEQIRASVGMALAQNPRLRVMLVREGSLLDGASMGILAQIAEEHDAQVWVERVTNGEKVGIVIEDGEVAEGGAA